MGPGEPTNRYDALKKLHVQVNFFKWNTLSIIVYFNKGSYCYDSYTQDVSFLKYSVLFKNTDHTKTLAKQ